MRASRIGLGGLVDVFVALLVVGAQLEVWLGDLHEPRWQSALLALGLTVPLLLRRRFPVSVPLLVWAVAVVDSYATPRAVDDSFVFFAVGWFTLWSSGANADRRRALGLLGAAWAATAIVVANLPDTGPADWLWFNAIGALAWVAGVGLRRRTEHAARLEERAVQLEQRREEAARVAVAEERARIARELHDVVAHSVSVMTVQASGVRRLLRPEQEREREALEEVERTGRQALAEMRRLLGVLRASEGAAALEPQPGLAQVESLLERARAAGLPVELSVEGERRQLSPGVDLSAYRIVQEGLTNALKHARDGRAEVRLRYRGERLEVEIASDGTPVSGADGGGHGLVGMRERALVCGGTLEASPQADGGFLVRATLPVESRP